MANQLRGDWLVAFVAVVQARSFTAAAKRMHRTQSAISMQIQQLETATGTQLLIRERGGVIPNEAGERLLPHARRIADALRDAAWLFGKRSSNPTCCDVSQPGRVSFQCHGSSVSRSSSSPSLGRVSNT
ncbi:LysR family transcriptional regulator, partial [Halomonas faecis]|uniref:LysR family transcriptional regulator n=1 Tax=Halomonas faecis TaxID=1562110 RepID=UPI0013D085CE